MSAGAAELARSIAARDLSCRQAVEGAIARIDAVDAETRAVACRRFEAALDEADEADRALASGRLSGVLHGVPITVGPVPTTSCSASCEAWSPAPNPTDRGFAPTFVRSVALRATERNNSPAL